jgi:protein-S-isoprenylcysteine O-methyltransferase Ste14
MAYRVSVLILGLIIAAYWARVLRMARKARQKTGRAANFLPPEPLGRVLRVLWIPIVIVWIVHPIVTALALPWTHTMAPLWASVWISGPAVAVACGCFWASRICWRTMGKNWRMGIDPGEQTSLVVAGPFAYVRHPIYALSQAMMLASIAALPSLLMIVTGFVHIVLMQWEARREERYMTQVHGQAYVDYSAHVRRFVPAPRRHL